jgi:hypothetical protein
LNDNHINSVAIAVMVAFACAGLVAMTMLLM